MNLPDLFLRRAPLAFALCLGFFLTPAGRAQPAPQIAENRFLFIFDTSADMKKRLPAERTELNQLLATSLGGQLHAGDSIGVWTFDRDLRAGQVPLQHWRPEDAANIAADINKFIGAQHYANVTRFNALQPTLNEVVHDSVRLTVLIFCDGGDQIQWTPYDTGINQAFQQRLAEQRKAHQPFVLVLRTQLGKYTGCTMNFPPGMVNLPDFPPLPPPPAPASTSPTGSVSPPSPAPAVKPSVGPPLIIIGRTVETNWPPAPLPPPARNPPLVAPTNAVPAGPARPVVPPPLPTNPAPQIQSNATPPPTNLFAPATPTNLIPVVPSHAVAATNAAAPPPENSGSRHRNLLVIGVACLIGAMALAALAFARARRGERGSLISRSMKKD